MRILNGNFPILSLQDSSPHLLQNKNWSEIGGSTDGIIGTSSFQKVENIHTLLNY